MELKKRFQAIFEAQRGQYDYMEIRLETKEDTSINLKKSKLENLAVTYESGGNVRVLQNGGWAFVVFNSLDDLEEMAVAAVKQAGLVGKSESRFAPVQPVVDEVRFSHANDPRKVSLDEKVNLLKKYAGIVDGYGEPINMSEIRYNENFSTITFANSEGTYIVQEKCDISGLVMAYATKDGTTEFNYVGFTSIGDFNDIRGKEAELEEFCRITAALVDAPRIKGGQYTVVLDSVMTGVFTHEAFGHLSEADGMANNPELQETMKPGRVFGAPELNIYDGPYEAKRGYYKYDDEGVRAEKTYLIKNGVLVGRLHNRETAAKMGEKPTGNARAINYKHPPIVRMTATLIEAGKHSFDELLKDIKEGIYMVKAAGGKTTGENFSFTSVYGYEIKDGKLGSLIKGVTLTGNVFTTLKNIEMIGSDECVPDMPGGCGKNEQQGLPVSDGGPHIRIRNVTIGGE